MTDFAAAKSRAQKIVASPKAYNRDNLVLATAFLELERLARAVSERPPDFTAKMKALRDFLGGE